jgi:uncharacterized protein (DUF488 family)
MRIRTVGHSTRTRETLLALLREGGVTLLADVRRVPQSRRHPQFGRDALASYLESEGIAYRHLPELGGRREPRPGSTNRAWREPAFRGYADYMGTPEFEHALELLLDLASGTELAILCAEADPSRCHRSLISDALVARGVAVEHLIEPGSFELHRIAAFALVEGGRVSYPGPALLPGLETP